jgi:hypothetical protein
VLESQFKRRFKDRLEEVFPGCVILDIDPINNRSMPDTIFLYDRFWAALEFKKSINSSKRPNQEYWITELAEMSAAYFVYPENQEEVMSELQKQLLSR